MKIFLALSIVLFQQALPSATASKRSSPLLSRSVLRYRGGSEDPYAHDAFLHPPNAPYENGESPNVETVQDRINTWRSHQRERAEQTQYSPRDEKGRMKLLTSVSKGYRVFVFFILMLRTLHLYEVADKARKGMARVFCVVPLITLFLANFVGMFQSFTSQSKAINKRLKGILNLNKFMELNLVVYHLLRLTILPQKYVAREINISRILESLLFILQAQAVTRLSWDEAVAQPLSSYSAYNQRPQHQSVPQGEGPDNAQWQESAGNQQHVNDPWRGETPYQQTQPPSNPNEY